MDDLEESIRAANPSPVRRDSPLTDRAELDLALIVSEHPTRHIAKQRSHVPRFTTVITSTVAAAFLVALAIIAGVLLTPQASMAAPPLLTTAPVSGITPSVLGRLSMTARTLQAASSLTITAETWSADIRIKNEHAVEFVQPSEVVRTRHADLSGEVVTYAGEVRWGTAPTGGQVIQPGSVLDRQQYKAGSYPLLFTAAPPADPGELAAYFAQYAGTTADSTAGDYFRAIADLRNDWSLDGMQTAAVLDFIAQLPTVRIAGEVTDRLGRLGIAVQTTSRAGGSFRDLLIFDQGSGALISAEQIYLGGLTDVDLSYPSVLDYTAWKEPK